MRHPVVFLLLAIPALGGCSLIPWYSYSNQEPDQADLPFPRPVENLYRAVFLRPQPPKNPVSGADNASIEVVPWNKKSSCRVPNPEPRDDCSDDRFVAMAISGGGSRAAIFSAEVMFELQRYGLLEHVDLVSCVSGGCLTAAYYALSCDDPGDKSACPPTYNGAARPVWTPEAVYPLLERHFLWRWFGNWFRPTNILKFWFTHYDRSDIMAETFSNNLYDLTILDNEPFRFRDLNPHRPNLAINATDITAGRDGHLHFAFTRETFDRIGSDLGRFPIANAVTASATFPGAFNYVTLRDFRNDRYIHLFDGGAYDNLGLAAVEQAMTSPRNSGQPLRLVILIDAYLTLDEKKAERAEPRDMLDFIVDSNMFDAYDTLMTSLRNLELAYAQNRLREVSGHLLHLNWEQLLDSPEHTDLPDRLNRISTSLSISEEDAGCLKRGAQALVRRKLDAICAGPDCPLQRMLSCPTSHPPLSPCDAKPVAPAEHTATLTD